MNAKIKNTLAVILGVIIGSIINMAIITISGNIIPPPNGVDVTTMEGLSATIHLFEPKHYIMPFLAHALGTLVGAYLTFKIATTHKSKLALAVGFWFLIGGFVNIYVLPSPIWFNLIDLIFAYIPMAIIGKKLAGSR